MRPQNPLGALGGEEGGVRTQQPQYSSRMVLKRKTPGIYLDLNSNDHRDQLFIQLSHHHQLLQRQAAQPADRHADGRTDGQVSSTWVKYEQTDSESAWQTDET